MLREHSLAASLLATEKDHSNPQGNRPKANGPLSSAQSVSQSLRQSVLKCPRSKAQASIALTSALICLRTSALRLASARFSFVSRPWVVCSAASRALPSSVLGPVLAPPWSLQRPTGSLAGLWQSVPLRVRASHLVPGQFGPKRVCWPIALPLVNISNTPIIRCYIITNLCLLIKAVYLDLI